MNKVKTIKVKNEDGSISEESYSIAADALNIDMVNGKNVQETIGTIDVDKDGDIATQLNKKINKSDIIDNLDSSDNNKVLSAKQGKVLNEAVAAANSDIKKKIYYFNTIAEMKADEDLAAGDTCQTLGYYSVNDGGAGLYKIVDDSSLIDDNGSVHNLGNRLKAELIVENNEVNIKQFGAKGDGEHDDTNAIQNAVDFLMNLYSIEEIFKKISTLTINYGRYIISKTINFPIVLNININGLVLLLSEVEDAPTIWINSRQLTKTNTGLNIIRQQSYNIEKTIGGNGVLCIERKTVDPCQDVNDLSKNSIGIEIGDREYNANYLNCARNTYENIAISGFTTAIQLNSINTYLINFNNVKLERNRNDFVYGKEGMVVQNSGENIKINNSTLAQSYNAYINNAGGQFTFNNTSFDYNGNDILCNHSCHLILKAPHIENVGFRHQGIIDTSDTNCIGLGTVIYNNYNSSSRNDITTVEIDNPNYYLASSTNKLIPRFQSVFNGNYPNLIINMRNLQPFNEAGYVYENVFMNTQNVKINHFNTAISNATIPTIPFNSLDNQGKLSNIPDNTTSTSALNDNYGFSTQNIESFSVNTGDKIFNKSLEFIVNQKNYFNIRRKIYNPTTDKMTSVLYIKPNLIGDSDNFNNLSVNVTINFYNNNNIAIRNALAIDLSSSANLLKNNENGWILIKPIVFEVPIGCQSIMIQYSFINKNSSNTTISASGNVLLGGFIVDNIA